MKIISSILLLTVLLSFSYSQSTFAGIGTISGGDNAITINDSDAADNEVTSTLVYFFDLRERETFIQFTYFDGQGSGLPADAHVQIFNVGNLCNENNFFDTYTINDTHVYNMRDIQTNNGNPSGVDLPDDAYGIVVISSAAADGTSNIGADPVGNFRIIDNNGYEYRTNAQTAFTFIDNDPISSELFYSVNYNTQGGVSLSDIVGITLFVVEAGEGVSPDFEFTALPVQGTFSPFDVDIYDLNEVPFSCRDIIFSCVDQNNPLLEEVLEVAGTANVAAFEYGINDVIPHSKGGELLCPGNVITDGVVVLNPELYPETSEFNDLLNQINGQGPLFYGYAGLNNGNGRGSMDSFWAGNICLIGFCDP